MRSLAGGGRLADSLPWGLRHGPFLGEVFEHLRRLVADDVASLRHRTDERPEDGGAAQVEVGAAVVRAHLEMGLENLLRRVEVTDDEFAVRAAGDDPPCVFSHCRCAPDGGERPATAFGSPRVMEGNRHSLAAAQGREGEAVVAVTEVPCRHAVPFRQKRCRRPPDRDVGVARRGCRPHKALPNLSAAGVRPTLQMQFGG